MGVASVLGASAMESEEVRTDQQMVSTENGTVVGAQNNMKVPGATSHFNDGETSRGNYSVNPSSRPSSGVGSINAWFRQSGATGKSKDKPERRYAPLIGRRSWPFPVPQFGMVEGTRSHKSLSVS